MDISEAYFSASTGDSLRSMSDRVNDRINLLDKGVDPTGVTDSYDAIMAAHDALQPGQELYLPRGARAATSQTLTFSKRQIVIDFQGAICPHGDHDDFLIDFNQDGADPEYLNVAYMLDIKRLEIDGMLQSRGVRFDQLYLSNPQNVRVFNAYGTAVSIDNSMEDSWTGLVIANGLRRSASWLGSATAWDSVTSYGVGDKVHVAYTAYSSGSTYAANAFVSYGGRSYRSLLAGNNNKQPDTNPTWWQPVPTEYFECMIANSNKDPHSASNYTTNSAVSGDKYWKQVYADEAALEIVNTYGTEVVDNQRFFAPMFRHNDHKVLIRIDNIANSRRVVGIEFYGAHIHQIIDAYLSAFPQTGQEAQDYSVIVQLGHATWCNFIGGTSRAAESEFVTHFQFGMKNPNKLCNLNQVHFMNISGEGQGNYGLSIMPGASGTAGLTAVASNNLYAFTSSATSPRSAGDTGKVVSRIDGVDILTPTTPANFVANKATRVADASQNVYLEPKTTPIW